MAIAKTMKEKNMFWIASLFLESIGTMKMVPKVIKDVKTSCLFISTVLRYFVLKLGLRRINFSKLMQCTLQNAMHPLNVQCDPKLSENPFLLNFFVAAQLLQDAPAGP